VLIRLRRHVDVETNMDLTESQMHSFIIKLSFQAGDETGRVIWHGYITHVPGGERRYLTKLSDITDFITGYLDSIGVERESNSRINRWLSRLGLLKPGNKPEDGVENDRWF
jgi:hypothetical protein